jgi:hypothetical protein
MVSVDVMMRQWAGVQLSMLALSPEHSFFGAGGSSESVFDSGSEHGCPPAYGWSIVSTSLVI